MRQLLLDIAPPEVHALDNFVPGRNMEVLAGLRDFAAGRERFVYLWGPQGCGKTHLLRALAGDGAYFGRSHHGMLNPEHDRLGLVAVDDVQDLGDAAQVSLFDLYNRMRESGGRLLAAGDAPPAALALRPELTTRLGWGIVYQVWPLTDAEKAQALARRGQARGYSLRPDVTSYLLTHADRDLPSLLALLDALDRYSMETKRDITVPLLRELLRPAGG